MAGELVLNQAFAYEVIDGLTRTLKTNETVLQDLYGVQDGGPHQSAPIIGKSAKVDVFDNARQVAQVVPAVQDYPRGSASPLGKFDVTCCSMAEQWLYEGEDLDKLREIGGPSSVLDQVGRAYLGEQLIEGRKKLDRTREAILAGVLGNRLFLKTTGNSQKVEFTNAGGGLQVDMGVPATHLNQLNANIAATWANAASTIVVDKDNIFKFASGESGFIPTWWLWNSVTWGGSIYGNTQVKNLAGTSNQLWTEYKLDENTGLRRFVLAAMPDVVHWVYDGLVDLDGAAGSKLIPDNMVIMTPPPNSDWIRGLTGSALYGPLPGELEPRRAFGKLQYFDWEDNKTETVLEQNMNDVWIAYLRVKKAIFAATVIF
jgi:hypothetical protein